MSRILVTGAAGFIGSHTTDALLSLGHEVVGVDNFRTGNLRNLKNASRNHCFSLVHLDITSEPEFENLVKSFQPAAIIHLAALVSVQESVADPEANNLLNFEATKIVARAALNHEIRRLVFASTAAVYGSSDALPLSEMNICKPISPYGEAKLASEQHLMSVAASSDIIVRCNRYFNVYGPRQAPGSSYSGVISIFADCLKRGVPPTIFGDGSQSRDFINVRDVARANVLASTSNNITSGVANICSGQEISLIELLKEMASIFATDARPAFAPHRAGDILRSCGCSKQARADLGFSAQISLHNGLRELLTGVVSA